MGARLQVIIIGAGRAGSELHLDAFRLIPDVKVIAICDQNLERARGICDKKGVPNAYRSLDEALAHHKTELVSICTPPQSHLELARRAMGAGAHVLMEKPIAMTAQEANEMWSYSQAKGLKLGVVHNYKFRPGVQRAIRMVKNGEIGDVLHVEKTWLSNGAKDRMVVNKDFWCHELVGGRWAETLPHHLYIPYQFLGPMRVSAVVVKDVHGRWPWLPGDEILAVLESDRATLTVRLSENALQKEQHMLICGTKGILFGDYNSVMRLPVRTSGPVKQFINGTKGILGKPLRAVRKILKKAGSPSRETAPRPQPKPGHLPVIEGFVNHLLRGAPEPVTWEEAYWTMKTTEEIGKAIEANLAHKRR